MNRTAALTLCALIIAISTPVCLTAQVSNATGEIKGTVQDTSRAAIPGATVTATDAGRGNSRTIATDQRGDYRLLSLPPGVYELRFVASGFATQTVENVTVTVGQALTVGVVLSPQALVQTLNVAAEQPAIEIERTEQSNTILEHEIRNLPIDLRNYLDLSLLMPGVVDSSALADNSDFRPVQTAESGLSFYGSNGRGNNVSVDGAEVMDAVGGVRATISQEAVQEFRVNRSNYAAEFGGASGGNISIISKQGTNRAHGSLFGFFRHDKMDAADPFAVELVGSQLERIKPPAHRAQYGGNFGFPIRKGRTFFFGAFETLDRNESSAVPVLTDLSIFQPTPAQTAVISQLAADQDPNPVSCLPAVSGLEALPPAVCAQVLTATLTAKSDTEGLFRLNSGVFPFKTFDRNLSARFDHLLKNQDPVFARFSYSNKEETNPSARALVGLSRSNRIDAWETNAAVGWTHIGGSNFINEFGFQWNYRDYDFIPNDPYGPEINIPGYGFFNRDIFLPNYTILRRYEFRDNVTYTRGTHRLKFGSRLLLHGNWTDARIFFGGSLGFGELPGGAVSPPLGNTPITAVQAFDLGIPYSYIVGFGDPRVSALLTHVSFFAQDTWDIQPNITINYGLRYDVDDRKDPLPTDLNNFAPRIGLSWDPGNTRKTVIRTGYGIYFAPTYFFIDYVANSVSELDGVRPVALTLSVLDPANPAAVDGPINIYQTLKAQGVIGIPNSSRMVTPADLAQFGIQVANTGPRPPLSFLFQSDSNYRSAYAQQASLSIEHEFSPSLTGSVSYISARTLKTPRSRDANLLEAPVGPLGIRDWSTLPGNPCAGAAAYGCFGDPTLLGLYNFESSGRALYNGFILEVQKRLSRGFALTGNYTFSKALDDVTDFNPDLAAFDQTNLAAEYARSSFDQRHKVVIYGQVTSPYNLSSAESSWQKILADFVVTPIFRANSGRPFNLLAGVDLNGDRNANTDRPPGAGRNTGVGPDFWTLDLRLARRIPLHNESNIELIAETFNVTNRLNYSSVNNTVGPGFKAPFRVTGNSELGPSQPLGFTSAFEPRRLQLGIRMNF